MIFHTCKL